MTATAQPPHSQIERKRVRIGGAFIDSVSLPEALEKFDQMISQRRGQYGCFCEAHLCVRATSEAAVGEALEKASLVLPDGVATTLGARLIGKRLPERLPGPRMMLELCRHGLAKGYKHFFYGGEEGVAEQLAARLRQQFEGIEIVGTYCPPFRPLTEQEEAQVKELVESSGADILWVALGAPKQELWVARHAGIIEVPLMLAVGAAFDFHSGRRKWAPAWIRKIGMEWLYRMVTGGKRVFLRNLTNLPKFGFIIFKQAAGYWLGRLWRLGRA